MVIDMAFETIKKPERKDRKSHEFGQLTKYGLYIPFDKFLKSNIGEDFCFAIDKEERKVAIMAGTMYSDNPFKTSSPDISKRILFFGSRKNLDKIMEEFPEIDVYKASYFYELHVDDGFIWFEIEKPVDVKEIKNTGGKFTL